LRSATGTSHPETAWSALRAANQKAALAGDKMDFFSRLATLYEKSRTHFQRNGGLVVQAQPQRLRAHAPASPHHSGVPAKLLFCGVEIYPLPYFF
jgi:hypothetical protein